MRGQADLIVSPNVDDPITAQGQRLRDEALRKVQTAVAGYSDSTGFHQRPVRQAADGLWRWAKLATGQTLSAGGTATFDFWQASGGGWEGWDESSGLSRSEVYAPPSWPSGEEWEDTDNKIFLLKQINGRWIAMFPQPGSPEGESVKVLTNISVQAGANTISKTSRNISVLSFEDPDTSVVHTGTECP